MDGGDSDGCLDADEAYKHIYVVGCVAIPWVGKRRSAACCSAARLNGWCRYMHEYNDGSRSATVCVWHGDRPIISGHVVECMIFIV